MVSIPSPVKLNSAIRNYQDHTSCIDSLMIPWVSNQFVNGWKHQFLFNEIRIFSDKFNIVFQYELRSANSMSDALAK